MKISVVYYWHIFPYTFQLQVIITFWPSKYCIPATAARTLVELINIKVDLLIHFYILYIHEWRNWTGNCSNHACVELIISLIYQVGIYPSSGIRVCSENPYLKQGEVSHSLLTPRRDFLQFLAFRYLACRC